MEKAVAPFRGKVVLTQWKHKSPFGGKLVNGALDFVLSFIMKLTFQNGVYIPLIAKPIQIQPRIGNKDGFVVFQLKVNGLKWMCVHIIPNPNLKVGVWYKKGTKAGTLDPKPVNATGAHFHLHMFEKDNDPIDLKAWYKKRGVSNWYSDPFGLEPKN